MGQFLPVALVVDLDNFEIRSETGRPYSMKHQCKMVWCAKKMTANVRLTLADLPDDIQLSILQFLDVESLCCGMTYANEMYCNLLTCSNRRARRDDVVDVESSIWKPLCQQLLVAALSGAADIPRIADGPFESSDDRQRHHQPSFDRNHSRNAAFTRSESDSSIVQFTGIIGRGNRCLTSDTPLPRPSDPSLTLELSKVGRCCLRMAKSCQRIRQRVFRRKHKRNVETTLVGSSSKQCIPFVVPFYATCQGSTVLDLTPRYVSYYEVSIQSPLQGASTSAMDDERERLGCVAVGLATLYFTHSYRRHVMMPGWDRHSFGYHGDDGGLYHGAGRATRKLPKFGAPGDCIGCGVDYRRQVVFYTLNGELLGTAFHLRGTDLADTPLYPVIGVDTNRPIRCNFGTDPGHPFVFDLRKFISRDMDVVVDAVNKAIHSRTCHGTAGHRMTRSCNPRHNEWNDCRSQHSLSLRARLHEHPMSKRHVRRTSRSVAVAPTRVEM
jgi:SPRY domain